MAKPLAKGLMQQAVDALAEHGGNKARAAAALGLPHTTFKCRITAAKSAGLVARTVSPETAPAAVLSMVEGLRSEVDRLKAELAKASRPHFTLRQETRGSASKIRIVCIGDAHDSPAIPDKSRFEWMGKYIRETKPDMVIQIGDFATMDSLSAHTPNHTLDGKLKPSFENDMGSFNLALQAMQIDGIDRHITLGNHERRLYAYENENPEMEGKLSATIDDILKHNGWTYSPYGMPYSVGGVSFVHACLNKLGKTYGGKNAEGGAIANDAIGDWVIGHSHVERRHRAPKLGHNNYIQIINVGCALPDQHIEDYAQHSLTGWSYGIADMSIQHGHVQDYHFVSMAALGERYGH